MGTMKAKATNRRPKAERLRAEKRLHQACGLSKRTRYSAERIFGMLEKYSAEKCLAAMAIADERNITPENVLRTFPEE